MFPTRTPAPGTGRRIDPMEMARTIVAQLGGSKFFAMTGAKNPLALGNGLQLDLPSRMTNDNLARMHVLLVGDLYEVVFFKKKKVDGILTFKEFSRYELVYSTNLQAVFTAATGLDTHL